MAKSSIFRTIPLAGGSKEVDERDMELIEENLKRFNKPGERHCLVCDKKFYGEGFHNRICKKCRAKYGDELFENRRYHNRHGAERRGWDKRTNYT